MTSEVESDRMMSAKRKVEDIDAALRPKSLDEFIGQEAARANGVGPKLALKKAAK
ncbi:hypothetical protein GCM10009096_15950 [Parasphingorhabdus litoris]|uniref:Holliday junction branch migration DNA helicase RuvB n=1 Tax=Parasphingorhabdus litoris TaxID=394733 RepID=A0ABP3KAQ6_9SPHN